MATSSQYGAFIPTTFIVQIAEVENSSLSPEQKRFFVDLYQYLNQILINLNIKDVGQYPLMEVVNGQLWFPNPNNNSTTASTATQRQVLRTVLLFTGSLPNNGSQSIAHNITVTNATTFTRIYATATNPGTGSIALPNASTTITTSTTNVIIATTANLTAYTITYVVLEYIQS